MRDINRWKLPFFGSVRCRAPKMSRMRQKFLHLCVIYFPKIGIMTEFLIPGRSRIISPQLPVHMNASTEHCISLFPHKPFSITFECPGIIWGKTTPPPGRSAKRSSVIADHVSTEWRQNDVIFSLDPMSQGNAQLSVLQVTLSKCKLLGGADCCYLRSV